MKPGEIVVIIMLVLAGAWIASKILGLVWDVIGGPVSRAFWYFFEVRYPEEEEEEPAHYAPASVRHFESKDYTPALPAPIMSRENRVLVAVPPAQVPVPGPGTLPSPAEIAERLTEDQLFEAMVLARNKNGKPRYSGKKLYALRGGNHAEFLALVRRLRGDDQGEMPEEPTILTPIAGRPTKASLYADPEFVYQPPPD